MAATDAAVHQPPAGAGHQRTGGISSSLLGMVLFIASEVMFFGGLFGAYFTLRTAAPQWPPPGTPHLEDWYALVLTGLLVSSSVTMQLGVYAIRKGNQRALVRYLGVSLFLGLCFLAGQANEYHKLIGEGLTLSSGVFGSTFFTLTGFHGGHVAGGAAFITVTLLRARSGQFTARYHDTVEMCSYYWHFVDVVWLGLVSTIYLLSR